MNSKNDDVVEELYQKYCDKFTYRVALNGENMQVLCPEKEYVIHIHPNKKIIECMMDCVTNNKFKNALQNKELIDCTINCLLNYKFKY
jgi:c-di-AMP phosphodiesterase-like protein